MDATLPAATASRRERLEALRDSLADLIAEGVGARDFAALSREYRATLAELDALPAAKEVSAADEIAERRARRQANAHRSTRTAGS